MSDAKLIKITIQDTENVLFQGTAERITSYNEIGRFDIYPMHANFISILRQELAVYLKHEKIKELKFERAVMKVKKDLIDIYLGIDVLMLEELNTKSPAEIMPKKAKS